MARTSFIIGASSIEANSVVLQSVSFFHIKIIIDDVSFGGESRYNNIEHLTEYES